MVDKTILETRYLGPVRDTFFPIRLPQLAPIEAEKKRPEGSSLVVQTNIMRWVNSSGHFVCAVGVLPANTVGLLLLKMRTNPQHKASTIGFSPLSRLPVHLGHPKSTQVKL